MGGLPVLWAEFNTTDANGNPVDLSQRETYYYYVDSNTGQKYETFGVKNTLTAEEAAQYTLKNVMGGDDGWQPDLMCEACDAPSVGGAGGEIVWQQVPYAICYVVTCGDQLLGITTGTSFPRTTDGDYCVQAVNEYGGLSTKGFAGMATGVNNATMEATDAATHFYTIDGRKASGNARGLIIARGSNGSVKKHLR